MLHRNGVEQEIEVPGRSLHLGIIGGHDHMVRTLATSLFGLARRTGEQGHLGAHGLGELDAHVAQAAHAENPDLVTGLHAVVLER
ncbi:hypothetical protein D9M69_574110 [compost metagenome]